MEADNLIDYINFGMINNDWHTEVEIITIIRMGTGDNYDLEDDIMYYIKLGPNYLSIISEIYDTCMGQVDNELYRLESSKSNWKKRLDPLFLNTDKEFILKKYKQSVEMFNEACRNFGSEEENEILFNHMFMASCFVRDLFKDDKEELTRVFESLPFFYRCFPMRYRFFLKTEMQYNKNVKFEKRKMASWLINIPIVKKTCGKGNQLQESYKKNITISKEECEKKTVNNTGKFYIKDKENANLKLESSKIQAVKEITDEYFENNASSTMNLSLFVILVGIFLFFINFRNFDSSKKCFFLILISMAFLGVKIFSLDF